MLPFPPLPPVGAGVLVALLPFPPLPPVGAGELVPLLPQNCCFKVGSFAKSTTYVCAHAALLDSAHNALNSWALGGASLFMTELIAGHPAIALLLWFPPLPPVVLLFELLELCLLPLLPFPPLQQASASVHLQKSPPQSPPQSQ